jgi:hypothetical protein
MLTHRTAVPKYKVPNRSNCSIPRIESGVRSSVEVKPGTGGKKGRSAGIDFITYLPETRLSGILPIFDGCKLVSELRTTARGQNPSRSQCQPQSGSRADSQ